jgi:ankyrin repeat protein
VNRFLALTLALVPIAAAAQDADKAARKTAAEASLRKQHVSVSSESLQGAVMSGNVGIVQSLLDAGADPNHRDETLNRTPLAMATSLACLMKRVEPESRDAIIASLLAAGANPNSVEMGDVPLLVYVAQKCPRPVIEALVKGGAKLDGKSPQGFTALSMALIVSNLDAAEALVDQGARLTPEAKTKLLDGATDPKLIALVNRASGPK